MKNRQAKHYMILKPLLFILLLSNYLVADTIPLQQGWNLVGTNSQMSLQEIKDQLGDENLLVVQGGGKTYNKNNPSHLNNFTGFESGNGYWIKVDNDNSLEFTPFQTSNTIQLQSGWNLIDPHVLSLEELKTQVGDENLIVVQGGGKTYNKNNPSHLNSFTGFEEPYGYWVKIQSDVTVSSGTINTPPEATAQSVTLDEDTNTTITLAGEDVDGNTLTYHIVTAPTNGTYVGTTYTPNENYNGSDSFTFKANDTMVDSETVTVSITVTPVNDVPIATAQSITLDEDTNTTIILAGTDIDENTLTYTVVDAPTNGTYVGATYTPNENYNGSDSFTFKANDTMVDSETVTVTITVTPVNDAPIAIAQSITLDEDTNTTIILAGTDIDENTLTYTVVDAPTNGTYVGTTYTPNANYDGSDSFTFKANDDTADSETVTVSITVNPVNDAPTVEAGASITITQGSSYTPSPIFSDSDGTVVNTVWKEGDSVLSFPKTDFSTGVHTLTITVTDNEGASSSDTLTLTVTAPFKIKVKTDNHGISTNLQFKIPTIGDGYDYNVDCDSDGTYEATGVEGNYICNYDNAGEYTISISGTFPQIYFKDFTNTADNNKLLSIEQWGTGAWRSMEGAFYACANMTLNAIDIPNLTLVTDMSRMFTMAQNFNQDIGDWNVSTVTNMSGMFHNTTAFNQDIGSWDVGAVTNMKSMFAYTQTFNQDIGNWDVSSVTNMQQMFQLSQAFNQDISNWDVSSVTNLSIMFNNAQAFDQDIGSWDVSSATTMSVMFAGITLSTDNYDSLLNGWSQLELQQNVNFNGGNSKYSPDAEIARESIIDTFGWNITDGGSTEIQDAYANWLPAKNSSVQDAFKIIDSNTMKALIEPGGQIDEDDNSNTVVFIFGKINGVDTGLGINQNYAGGVKMVIRIYNSDGDILATSEELSYIDAVNDIEFNDINF